MNWTGDTRLGSLPTLSEERAAVDRWARQSGDRLKIRKLEDALEEIANYVEEFGGPPPEDAMREIAREALAR